MKRLNDAMRVAAFCAVFVSLTVVTKAQPTAKIYAALNAGDYERARTFLAKLKPSDDPAIAFAKARYYFESDNPKRQLDSAKAHAVRAQRLLSRVESKRLVKRNAALGVRPHHVNDLNERINAQAFHRAVVWNTVGDWNYFLNAFADAAQFAEAKKLRNELAFEQAKASNDPKRLQQFFNEHPEATEAAEARSLYEQLLYVQQTGGDSSWQAYKRFIDEHPESPFLESAKANYERLLYKDMTRRNTADAFASFVNAYPDSPFRQRAEDSLYARFTKPVATIPKLTQFVQRYAANRNAFNAWDKLYLLSTDGSDSSIVAFLEHHPHFPLRADAEKDTANNNYYPVKFTSSDYVGYKDSLTNRVLLPPEFWDLGDFGEGLVAATADNCNETPCRYGYYDMSGRERVAPKFSEAYPFQHGLAVVGLGDCSRDSCKFGFINRVGDFVVKPVYDDLSPVTNGRALVRLDTLYGFIDATGNAAVPIRFSDAYEFREGLAAVYDTAWKFIDTNGQTVIAGKFRQLSSFGNGLAAAADENGLWGYIDRSGRWVIKPQFTDAGTFANGKAKVNLPAAKNAAGTKPDRERWIDTKGRFLKAEP